MTFLEKYQNCISTDICRSTVLAKVGKRNGELNFNIQLKALIIWAYQNGLTPAETEKLDCEFNKICK